MLTVSGFDEFQTEEIRALFGQLTAEWPGGWCRGVQIGCDHDALRPITVDIAGWDRPVFLSDTPQLLDWMRTYWAR